jgi:hypothetical protein
VAFELPVLPGRFVHEVSMAERDGFQPKSKTYEGLGRAREAGLILREQDGLLRVEVIVNSFGMPRRRRRPPAVRLSCGEWLRWQVNYRFAGTHDAEWTYGLETLNVAYGPARANVFLGTPTREIRELAPLR